MEAASRRKLHFHQHHAWVPIYVPLVQPCGVWRNLPAAFARGVRRFVAAHDNARAYTSVGQLRYLSCIAQVDGVVGNSSSGLIGVPSFRKGTIDIGDRQRGRLRAASVIHCEPEREDIVRALVTLYSPMFQEIIASVENPYGSGGASERVVEVLKSAPLDHLVKKHFHDLTLG